MQSRDVERDDSLRVKRRDQTQGPRAAGGSEAPGLLSALGNARVQRLMRAAADGATVDDAVARAIQSKRGGGAPLDETARRTMEASFGEDFSEVRVHTDGEADSLNHAVQAEAFTTGRDIFFRSGAYAPGSSDGQKLLAHELTHVVQQRGAPPATDLTVSSPDDAAEREAAAVAGAFDPASAPAAVSRQAAPEEEEELAMSALDREAVEEEEEMATASLDRQDVEEEEEMLQGAFIDRQAVEEEEEMAMSRLDRQDVEEEEELPL